MANLEEYPDEKRCELCGQKLQPEETEYSAQEFIRRLAFIADESPAIALLLIYSIAGRNYAEIGRKMKITRQAVRKKIKKSHAQLSKLKSF